MAKLGFRGMRGAAAERKRWSEDAGEVAGEESRCARMDLRRRSMVWRRRRRIKARTSAAGGESKRERAPPALAETRLW
jgi:hypothetical protein